MVIDLQLQLRADPSYGTSTPVHVLGAGGLDGNEFVHIQLQMTVYPGAAWLLTEQHVAPSFTHQMAAYFVCKSKWHQDLRQELVRKISNARDTLASLGGHLCEVPRTVTLLGRATRFGGVVETSPPL